jgi:hypothetical protein
MSVLVALRQMTHDGTAELVTRTAGSEWTNGNHRQASSHSLVPLYSHHDLSHVGIALHVLLRRLHSVQPLELAVNNDAHAPVRQCW